MSSQTFILIIILIWLALNLLSLSSPIRRNNPQNPPLGKLRIFFIVLVELIAILLVLIYRRDPNRYLMSLGVLLLFIGWIVSNNRILVPRYDQKWLLRVRDQTFASIGIHRDFYFLSLAGDWIQLVGLSLVFNAFYGVVFSLTLLPILVHLMTISLMPPKPDTTDPRVIQPTNSFVWPGFKFILRVLFLGGIVLFFLSFLSSDLVLFYGELENARSLLEMLVQTEATVFTLALTFLFVIIEFTNTTYTPRLSKLIFNHMSFRIMVFLSLSSIVFKVALLSSEILFSKPMVNWALFSSIIAVFGFAIFLIDAFSLMSPESMVKETLKHFDNEWMRVVKDQWSSKWGSRTIYVDRDPFIVIERILVSSLERGDINSFITGLIQVNEKVMSICHPNDRVALDVYLSERLSSVVSMACNLRSDSALDYLCATIEDITTPTLRSLKDSKVSMFDVPPGCVLLMQILDSAVEARLQSSIRMGFYILRRRASLALDSLPPFSELYSINPSNYEKNLDEKQKDIMQKHDMQVGNYTRGYLAYFGKVGKKGIELGTPEVARLATSCLSEQIYKIIEKITDLPYQWRLLLEAWWAMDEIVKSACAKQVHNAISFSDLSFNLRNISDRDMAMMMAEKFSKYIISLSRAGILDYSIIIDIAVASSDLAWKAPEAVLILLEAYGDAGEKLKTTDNFSEREEIIFLLNEMYRRVDQIANPGLTHSIRTRVSKAAKKAKTKIKV